MSISVPGLSQGCCAISVLESSPFGIVFATYSGVELLLATFLLFPLFPFSQILPGGGERERDDLSRRQDSCQILVFLLLLFLWRGVPVPRGLGFG